jgi:general secretion pathway protein I
VTGARACRRQRGFSLLELLVAVAVMGLALTLLYQVDAGAVRGVADYATQQRAGVLARSILEARDAVPAAGWQEAGADAGFAWRVATAPWPTPPGLEVNAPALHEVVVSVQWSGRSGPQALELRTLLPQARPAPGSVQP